MKGRLDDLSVGLELAVTILLCSAVGYYVDRACRVAPWGLVGGSFLGMAIGALNFFRRFRKP